jgi:DNA polymerase-1
MQVHDELVLEVPKNKINEVSKIIKEKMENVIKLNVPLIVDVKIGDNWLEMSRVA